MRSTANVSYAWPADRCIAGKSLYSALKAKSWVLAGDRLLAEVEESVLDAALI
jgi:hypothetical protein